MNIHTTALLIPIALSACGALDSERSRPAQNYDSNMATVVGTIEVRPKVDSEERAGALTEKTENLLYGGSFFIRAPNGTGTYITNELNSNDRLAAKDKTSQPFALSLTPGKYKIINWSLSSFQNNQNSLLPKREVFFEALSGKTTYVGRFIIDPNQKMATIEDKYLEDVVSIKNLFFSTASNINDFKKNNEFNDVNFNNKLKTIDKSIFSSFANGDTNKIENKRNINIDLNIENQSLSYAQWMLPSAKNYENGKTEITANNIKIMPNENTQSLRVGENIVTTPIPSDIIKTEGLEVIQSTPIGRTRNTANYINIKPVIPRKVANLQLTRDLSARTIIEAELHKTNIKLNEIIKEFNKGQPEKLASEINNEQRYQNRIIEIKASIARLNMDIQSLQRELSRMVK